MNNKCAGLTGACRWLLRLGLLVFGLSIATPQTLPTSLIGRVPQAPPPAPPIEYWTGGTSQPPNTHTPKGLTLYSIGQPTDEEQLYLEFLNRMRANPTAEGQRLATTTDPNVLSAYSYFGVDTGLMQSEFSTNPAVPPLAMNAQLTAAARWHSGDMYTNIYQGHNQMNGSIVMNPGDRIHTNGYSWQTYGENVYSYSESVFYGHTGFAVDWGPGPGGMQTPAGHRQNMLNGNFREVGIGVFDGVNGSVGPQLVTQDFATLVSGATPLITGVVYYDFNGNGFYDIGEGIGGVTVNSPGSKYYALTADSGGYAIPVSSNGNYTLTFSASGLSNQVGVTVSGQQNLKADYVPVYSPPVITGPNPAVLNQSNLYTFSAVAGATDYQWQRTQLTPYAYIEGAENGLTRVSVVNSPGYSVSANDLVASGSASFHLAQPTAVDQSITLNAVLRPHSGSALSFAKLLGWADTGQVAKAQISTDGGATWQDAWSKPGTGTSGDSAFSTVTVPLSAYVGQNIQLRFVYGYTGGSYFPQTSSGVGLYLDDIAVSNADQLLNPITTDIGLANSFAFTPTNSANYLLQVRGAIKTRMLNWGPSLVISVGAAPPALQVVGVPAISGTQVQLDFTVTNFRNGMTFHLWTGSNVAGSWVQDSTATLQTLVTNSKFRFSANSGGAAQRFYRIKATY